MPEIRSRKPLFNPELRRRGIYVLPNLFTTAALFAGFYAIVQAMNLRFEHAAFTRRKKISCCCSSASSPDQRVVS